MRQFLLLSFTFYISLQIKSEAAFLYDAVWLYSRAADVTIKEGKDIYNGTYIFGKLVGQRYKSRFNN